MPGEESLGQPVAAEDETDASPACASTANTSVVTPAPPQQEEPVPPVAAESWIDGVGEGIKQLTRRLSTMGGLQTVPTDPDPAAAEPASAVAASVPTDEDVQAAKLQALCRGRASRAVRGSFSGPPPLAAPPLEAEMADRLKVDLHPTPVHIEEVPLKAPAKVTLESWVELYVSMEL